MNETQTIIKKLKLLRSSDDDKGKTRGDLAKPVEDLEAQLAALKVCITRSEEKSVFSPPQGSEFGALRGRCAHPKTQA